jgi:2-polyprenyl-6-methoxyphenol hydroxylase-like FAD-dependent oxidoreductase
MMEQIETAFITGMYYRDPIDRWTYGRVTLMGDAAHPMVPFLAQGACQGIEDAWTMATVLSNISTKSVDRRFRSMSSAGVRALRVAIGRTRHGQADA